MLGDVVLTTANASHLDSLSTIVARSFHPVNAYIRSVWPDTAAIRQYWINLFRKEIDSPNAHTLVLVEEKTNDVLGVLALRLMAEDERGSGMWREDETAADMNVNAYIHMVDAMTTCREQCMLGQSHFLIQLFGVDHKAKGLGLGKMLLTRACDIAAEEGHETFVQANVYAKDFYQKQGFVLKEVVMLPGDDKYEEFMLVRPVK